MARTIVVEFLRPLDGPHQRPTSLLPTYDAWRMAMAYAVKHGTDPNAPPERSETATACLERVKALKSEHELNIKIFDRKGVEITAAELERLSGKELI